MPGYDANIQVYYCKQNESPLLEHRIAPAPAISIAPEIYYVNDNVAGYTYNITLNGYANALRKENNLNSTTYGLEPTVNHIGYIREIFNINGGNLYIKQDGADILVAKGATIKSFNFNESDNKWVNYAPFTIELEFNEVDFKGCSANSGVDCNDSIFHNLNSPAISNHLIDIKKYKIKTFNDKWNFTIEDQIYQQHERTSNNTFKVSYNISATGKHYYVNNKLIPAWEQARNFVQDRLYNQVRALLNGVLLIESNNANNATKTIEDIHQVDSISPRTSGILSGFTTSLDNSLIYDVYNETIDCETSEADGTFSVTYNALIKKKNSVLDDSEAAALHTYTKNLTIDNNANLNATISIQGTITGLVKGGFIYYNNDFTLPPNGSFFIKPSTNWNQQNNSKYNNALVYFAGEVKHPSRNDLSDDLKTILEINESELLIKSSISGPILPSAFTVDHNYHEGTITYSASYERSSVITRNKGFMNISITRQDPVPVIQEFVVPGRAIGPIIQILNAKTARTVSVNIDGAHPNNKICSIDDVCNTLPAYGPFPGYSSLLTDNDSWVKTKEDYTMNAIDGSYSISLEFMVREC